MSTSKNKIVNKRAKDPIDRLIFEKGLRIIQVVPVKKHDSLVVILNNGNTISVKLSFFPRLKRASQQQLEKWELTSNGVGVEWALIDEDLSLKGLIRQLIQENTLRYVAGEYNHAIAA
ncbi:MAG TPA: DUF2442 domain-containing protein [Chitinophagales bacterium]|nr:DUF2442 domain-containing protein [Chitinophagales bacterium]